MARERLELKAVGYWRSWEERRFPRPQWLVREDWRVSERDRIVRYLQEGRLFYGCVGYSFCRFHCGIPHRQMGCYGITDGVWVWPQGLAHYVENHSVVLPEEFVETMLANDWQPQPEIARSVRETAEVDNGFWIAWAKRHQKRPWNYLWRGREIDYR
jgi:hypothetical protein